MDRTMLPPRVTEQAAPVWESIQAALFLLSFWALLLLF